MSFVSWARRSAAVLVPCLLACAPEGGSDGGPSGPTPPDPGAYSIATCTFTDGGGGTLELGLDWEQFAPAADGDSLQLYEIEGRTYAYFSVNAAGLTPSSVCLEYNLAVAEPDEPNEIVAFGRYEVDLDGDVDGALLLGIPMPLADNQQPVGKNASLTVTAGDSAGASASAQLLVVVKAP